MEENRNKEYYLRLNPQERKRFRKGLKFSRVGGNALSIKEYLKLERYSFLDFICGAFVWENTDEGHAYWSDLSDKYWILNLD